MLEEKIKELWNKVKQPIIRTGLTLAILAGSYNVAKATDYDMDLQFTSNIATGTSTADTFNAGYDTANGNIVDGYDPVDVKQPVQSEIERVQAYTIDTGYVLTKDYQTFDSVNPNVTWYVNLMATDPTWYGLTGTASFNVVDTAEIDKLPAGSNIHLYRYDENDVFVQHYDLQDANNHTIGWEVTNALGFYGGMELRIREDFDTYDIDSSGCVNLVDFTYLANDWLKSGSTYDADFDSDNDVDIDDLASFVNNWLCGCE